MKLRGIKFFMMAAVCAVLSLGHGTEALAAGTGSAPALFAVVKADNTCIFAQGIESSVIVAAAMAGNSYKVTGNTEDGWVKVDIGDTSGYLKPDGSVALYKESQVAEAAEAARAEADAAAEQAEQDLRQQIVDYALSFVGGRYVYGGNDPHTGVDCSGFTRYVMSHAAGISLERTSRAQAGQGTTISAEEIQPGDLVFYSRGNGSGGSVGHVAIYIGDGQIVHASTERTGIKVSRWDYKTPLRIARVVE